MQQAQALLPGLRPVRPCSTTATSMVVVPDPLAQLRIRARPAPCAGTRQRPPCPAARRAACAQPAGAFTWKPRSVPICKPWRRPMPHRRADSPPHDQQQHDGDTHGTWTPSPRRRLRLGCHPRAATMEPAAPGRRGALPQDPAVLHAWALFHNGEFQRRQKGLAAGGAGITAANKATAVYATYLEAARANAARAVHADCRARPGPGCRQRAARQRLVLERLRPGPLLPGHQRGQGPGAGLGPAGERIAGESHCPVAPACGSAHCAGHLPRRSHRQSGGDGGRHDLWRQERSWPAAV